MRLFDVTIYNPVFVIFYILYALSLIATEIVWSINHFVCVHSVLVDDGPSKHVAYWTNKHFLMVCFVGISFNICFANSNSETLLN